MGSPAMGWRRGIGLLVALATGGVWPVTTGYAAGAPPSVIFILLDTTRADRFSAWGSPRPTTPHFDALGASGARFTRHFANAHATRSSMPQLMTGRYYHPNILRPMKPLSEPREYYFVEADPSAVLLPDVLRRHGYRTVGVSAHPWVVHESAFGRAFDRLEFIAAEPEQGHVDAKPVVDRGLELWRARSRDRPTFLYLHFMDLHMPRWLPPGVPDEFAPTGWNSRFSAASKPLFGTRRRAWNHADAQDFTAADRRTFAAFYDALLAYTDREVGRLLAAVRADDPALQSVLIVVVADHGEELGEEGHIDHTGTLADGVQHIPFIVAGARIRPGQRFRGFSENVDVVPTILGILGFGAATDRARFDGRPLVAADGRLCDGCGKAAVHYAWIHYKGVRTRSALLRVPTERTGDAHCRDGAQLWQVERGRRTPVDVPTSEDDHAARLRRRVAARLVRREARFLNAEWRPPDRSFFVQAQEWKLESSVPLACPRVDAATTRSGLRVPGWQYARESFFVLEPGGGRPLEIAVTVPDGVYRVDAGVVPIGKPPWLFGFDAWLRRAFLNSEPTEFVSLGDMEAADRQLQLRLPEALGRQQRLVSLRLTPPGAAPATDEDDVLRAEPDYRERLRALGYVQ